MLNFNYIHDNNYAPLILTVKWGGIALLQENINSIDPLSFNSDIVNLNESGTLCFEVSHRNGLFIDNVSIISVMVEEEV